jgi:hypothetical protein
MMPNDQAPRDADLSDAERIAVPDFNLSGDDTEVPGVSEGMPGRESDDPSPTGADPSAAAASSPAVAGTGPADEEPGAVAGDRPGFAEDEANFPGRGDQPGYFQRPGAER